MGQIYSNSIEFYMLNLGIKAVLFYKMLSNPINRVLSVCDLTVQA